MIAAKAGGEKTGVALHRRFLDSLKLTTTFAGWEDNVTNTFAHNWVPDNSGYPVLDIFDIDKTGQLTLANTVGGVASVPRELARWSEALYEGKLLAKSTMSQMLAFHTWPGGVSYGLGVTRLHYGTK